MKRFTHCFRMLMLLSLLFASSTAFADIPLRSIDNQYVSFKTTDPSRDAGYVVGDKLERTLILTVKKPYELIKESLPIVGYEHRYRGQVSGIELVAISADEKNTSNATTHTIHLTYQVFKAARVAKPAMLRGEIVKLRQINSTETRQFQFPSFNFRVSPLSVYGEVNLKQEMSPLIKPFTMSTAQDERVFKIAAGLLLLSTVGLIYILGAYHWLPRMGGAFAKAYRNVASQPETEQGLQASMTAIHAALKQVAGHSVFSNSLDRFLLEKPAFMPAKPELEKFFSLSRQVFFDPNVKQELGMPTKQWLKTFCRHLRDCERGLKPEVK